MKFAFFFPGQGSQSLGMMNGFEGRAVVEARLMKPLPRSARICGR